MAKSPWDPETEELIKKAQMMIDTGAVDGERQKPNATSARPKMPSAKMKSTKMREKTASKRTARQEALKRFRKTGMIPASPTR